MNKASSLMLLLLCLPPAALGLETAESAAQKQAPAQSPACAPAAFLTLESGKLAGVDWIEYRSDQVHTRVVLTQSRIIDATIDLGSDQTARHSSVVLSIAGGEPEKPQTRDLGTGAIYWSDMIASSVEQAIARARVLGQPLAKIPTANLYHDSPTRLRYSASIQTIGSSALTTNVMRYWQTSKDACLRLRCPITAW